MHYEVYKKVTHGGVKVEEYIGHTNTRDEAVELASQKCVGVWSTDFYVRECDEYIGELVAQIWDSGDGVVAEVF